MRKSSVFKTLVLSGFFINIFYFIQAAPHISGKYIPGQPKDKVKILPDISHLRIKGSPSLSIAKALNTIGTKKIAVIIVDFEDKQFSQGWYLQANETFQKLKEYYEEVSCGKLNLQLKFFYNGGSTNGPVTGSETPLRMPRKMSFYGRDTNDTLAQLIKDAILATNGTVDKLLYDYVMVLHAGYGNESTSNNEDIWSVYVDWDGAVNGFTDGTIVPEAEQGASPVGVTCHEFGHQLGLPDLYYGQESIVGKWCLMDYGVWNGSPQGSQPSHLSAWCKQFLGWLDVEIISSTKKGISLHYVENISSAVIKIPIVTSNNPSKEYFLLEYRKKIGFDSSLPGEGLLIWRIDDNIASSETRLKDNDINKGDPHYGIDLIEADKTPAGKNYGDAGDPFPGFNNITIFSPQEYSITAYNGNPINIVIKDIDRDNTYTYFDILSITGLFTKVTRLDGSPLSNVKIVLSDLFNKQVIKQTYTSSNGSAVIELSSGVWSITCSLTNYLTYYDLIDIPLDQLKIKSIILRYDPQFIVKNNDFVIGNNYLDTSVSDKIIFRYNLEGASNIRIIVYTLTGNILKTFEKYHDEKGSYEEIWDVKNTQLTPGLYFAVFQSKYSNKVEKFVIK